MLQCAEFAVPPPRERWPSMMVAWGTSTTGAAAVDDVDGAVRAVDVVSFAFVSRNRGLARQSGEAHRRALARAHPRVQHRPELGAVLARVPLLLAVRLFCREAPDGGVREPRRRALHDGA